MKRTLHGRRRAARVIKFIETLTVPSGMGQGRRFKLATWQKKFIRDIYEPHRMGRRVVRRAILSIARKNGKTALIATLALAHLIGPEAIRTAKSIPPPTTATKQHRVQVRPANR